ncbi:hypothetical protein PAMP_024621 [Pampus punctatissimus]
MNIQCKLVVPIFVLILGDQVNTGEIYGGHEAKPHSRPYMVIVERMMQNGNGKTCDGFLLNEDFVMTAAHCQAKSYEVLLGVHNIYGDGIQRVAVDQTFPRNDYNKSGYKNDIMLLKMRSKAHFSNYVKPIALAGQGSLPKTCIVSGWGSTESSNGYMSTVLLEVNVTLSDITQCYKENSYCSVGDHGPGEGDSGGPLVCEDGKAYGVVSSTFKPHSGGPPIHHYAKIPDYRPWIDLAMMKNNGKL